MGFSVNSINMCVKRVKSLNSFMFVGFLNTGSLSTSSHLFTRKVEDDCNENFVATVAHTTHINVRPGCSKIAHNHKNISAGVDI
jgi:hypothetical protein